MSEQRDNRRQTAERPERGRLAQGERLDPAPSGHRDGIGIRLGRQTRSEINNSPESERSKTDPNEPGNHPLLRVRGLSVRYRVGQRETTAVAGVDFDVERGEIVAIVGESGSGKTTTAHAVINLLAPGAIVGGGELVLDGTTLTSLSRSEWQEIRGRRIALIPQDPAVSLNPVTKIGKQIAEVLRIHKLASRREAEQRALELLELVGIPEPALRAKQYPHQLSGGMNQRALIATALAGDPELIIADEPTSALDVTVQKHILDHLTSLARERNTAVLLITHDLAVASDRADRIIVMQRGQIVETGPAEHVLNSPQHPYTRALVAAAPALSSERLVASDRARHAGRQGAGTDAPTGLTASSSGLESRPASGSELGSEFRSTTPCSDPVSDSELGAASSTADPTLLLSVQGLRKEFPIPGQRMGRFAAVDGISFTIAPGETFALLGESGSGKSTTARLVTRLESATSGTLKLHGSDYGSASGEELRQLRRRLQLVYQNPYASLDPRFSVSDIVEEPLRAYGVGTSQARRATAVRLLDEVALPNSYLSRKPAELSGGQRQRIAIARALALKPELLVLDEAVSALDVSVQAQILHLLTDLQAEYRLSYLFITHDLAVARQISDRVAVMHHGKIVESGTTSEILDNPREQYTADLVDAIPGSLR